MQNKLIKFIVLIFIPFLLGARTPSFKERIINWSKYITWNVDRTKLYEAFTTVNTDLYDYLSTNYVQKIYQEGNSRVELFKKINSNNKKLVITSIEKCFL